MPSGLFAHVCLLVEDLDQAIEDWSRILGVLDPSQLEEQIVSYDAFEGGDDSVRWATFVSGEGTEIQLMQPGPGTPLARRLAKHGEHVHHLCFTADDVEEAAERLRDAGVSVSDRVSQDPDMPWQRWTWVMPDSAHGTLVEVARPYLARDGKWVSGQ